MTANGAERKPTGAAVCFRLCPRLCENAQEPTRRRIVSSIAFFRGRPPALFVFRLTKSRRTFYAQIERQRFYTAWPHCGHRSEAFAAALRAALNHWAGPPSITQ